MTTLLTAALGALVGALAMVGVLLYRRDSQRHEALVEHVRTRQRVGTFPVP